MSGVRLEEVALSISSVGTVGGRDGRGCSGSSSTGCHWEDIDFSPLKNFTSNSETRIINTPSVHSY